MKIILKTIPPTHTHQSTLRIFKPNGLNRYIVGHNKKGIETQNHLYWLVIPYKPKYPLETALKVNIKYVYPFRSNEPKKNRIGEVPKTTKCDCDNLAKQICDVLTKAGFWKDDAQIYDLHFSKWWGAEPRIEIEIESY